MNDRTMRWGIGLFVLAALVLMGVLIVMFGSLPTFFKRANLYTIRFVDAPGVGPGTPVRRSGVRIGEVSDVLLDDERGIVRVQVAIDPRYTIRRNEQPTLNIGLLGSDVSIDFVPEPTEEGQPVDRSVVEPGSEMVGIRPANVNTLLNRASQVAPTAQDALNEIRRSLQRLERMSPLAEETMREYRDLAKDVRRAIPDLQRTNQEVQGLTKDFREALPKAQRNLDDLGAAARNWGRLAERLDIWAQGNLEALSKVIDNLNTTLTRVSNVFNEENQQNLANILRNISTASQRFDSISRNLDAIMQDSRPLPKRLNETLNHTDETMTDLRKAIKPYADRGESISRNLDESAAKLNRLLTDLSGLRNTLDQDGTVQRLLKDPSLYANLNEAACLLLRGMPRIERILKDMETFADKLARHPELLGVRGAIRPSEGLKQPPQPFHPPMIVPDSPPP